jgi:hypothetical protein
MEHASGLDSYIVLYRLNLALCSFPQSLSRIQYLHFKVLLNFSPAFNGVTDKL